MRAVTAITSLRNCACWLVHELPVDAISTKYLVHARIFYT